MKFVTLLENTPSVLLNKKTNLLYAMLRCMYCIILPYSIVTFQIDCMKQILNAVCDAESIPVVVKFLGSLHRSLSDKFQGTSCVQQHQGTFKGPLDCSCIRQIKTYLVLRFHNWYHLIFEVQRLENHNKLQKGICVNKYSMQIKNGTGSGVRRSERSIFACHTRGILVEGVHVCCPASKYNLAFVRGHLHSVW